MRIDQISECRICKNNNLIELLDLGLQSLGGRFPSSSDLNPPKSPLKLLKCNDLDEGNNNCGLLQLSHNIDQDELFLHNYGYRSGINETMKKHLRKMVEYIEREVTITQEDIILDIGSNDGTLLKSYSKNSIKIGIDPTIKQFQQYYPSDIIQVPTYFSASSYFEKFKKRAKVITSISMFYDLPKPVEFVENIKKCLDFDGIWILEQSYMPTMLETNSFDTICHEHLEYYAFKQIYWIMKQNSLKIIDVFFNEINGGSFRIVVSHENSEYKSNMDKINQIISNEKQLELNTLYPYEKFKKQINLARERCIQFINTEVIEKNKRVFIYGASTKGNTLLQYFNLNNHVIEGAAERNSNKYGCRTPGTNIPIISEAEAREKADYFFVLPWHFRNEFLIREKNFVVNGGALVFPLPNFEIIRSDYYEKNC